MRAYVDHIGRTEDMATLIRYSSRDGFLLVPPSLRTDGKWVEERSARCAKDIGLYSRMREHERPPL